MTMKRCTCGGITALFGWLTVVGTGIRFGRGFIMDLGDRDDGEVGWTLLGMGLCALSWALLWFLL